MGKSWKEKPEKWKRDKGFQKKQKRNNKNRGAKFNKNREYSPFEDSMDLHESFS